MIALWIGGYNVINASMVTLRMPDDLRKVSNDDKRFSIDFIEELINEAYSTNSSVFSYLSDDVVLPVITDYVSARLYERVGNITMSQYFWQLYSESVKQLRKVETISPSTTVHSNPRYFTDEEFDKW
jgi:hypothetical protein